jgi:4,5-DOPA dioxygenase extradiol
MNERKENNLMPVLFLGHGSPMNAIQDNEFTRGFREIGQQIPRPSSILVISAHWETHGVCITAMDNPRTIHDFGGFPPELYSVKYPSPGNPELATAIQARLPEQHIKADYKWGLDHGAWSVVKHMYPEADIPVIQMSLSYCKKPLEHYELAKELMRLRQKGVLIIGSGNMVHNLGMVAWDKLDEAGYAYDWAKEAGDKMKQWILNDNHDLLINYGKQGRAFTLAIPTPDHYLPLLYTLGLKQKNEPVQIFNDQPVAGSLSMTSVKIGA